MTRITARVGGTRRMGRVGAESATSTGGKSSENARHGQMSFLGRARLFATMSAALKHRLCSSRFPARGVPSHLVDALESISKCIRTKVNQVKTRKVRRRRSASPFSGAVRLRSVGFTPVASGSPVARTIKMKNEQTSKWDAERRGAWSAVPWKKSLTANDRQEAAFAFRQATFCQKAITASGEP